MTLHADLWRSLFRPDLTEVERHDRAWQWWREAGHPAVAATAEFATDFVGAIAASYPDGIPLAPPPPAETLLTDLGDPERQLHAAQSAWNFLSGAFTSVQLDAVDPLLGSTLDELASSLGGDVIFWLAHWGLSALENLVGRTEEAEFEDFLGALLTDRGVE